MTQEALKLALDALECALSDHRPYIVQCKEAITAIKEALAQTQEPVAYSGNSTAGREADVKPTGFFFQMPKRSEPSGKPSAWIGLTNEDISEVVRGTHNTGSFVRAIEAKLKEKNMKK